MHFRNLVCAAAAQRNATLDYASWFPIRVIFVIGKLHSIDYHLIDLIVRLSAWIHSNDKCSSIVSFVKPLWFDTASMLLTFDSRILNCEKVGLNLSSMQWSCSIWMRSKWLIVLPSSSVNSKLVSDFYYYYFSVRCQHDLTAQSIPCFKVKTIAFASFSFPWRNRDEQSLTFTLDLTSVYDWKIIEFQTTYLCWPNKFCANGFCDSGLLCSRRTLKSQNNIGSRFFFEEI